MKKNEKGFVLVFVMAVTAALSIMTSAMYFYYDNDLKSVSRNSVMQQVTLAPETGLQEGKGGLQISLIQILLVLLIFKIVSISRIQIMHV